MIWITRKGYMLPICIFLLTLIFVCINFNKITYTTDHLVQTIHQYGGDKFPAHLLLVTVSDGRVTTKQSIVVKEESRGFMYAPDIDLTSPHLRVNINNSPNQPVVLLSDTVVRADFRGRHVYVISDNYLSSMASILRLP